MPLQVRPITLTCNVTEGIRRLSTPNCQSSQVSFVQLLSSALSLKASDAPQQINLYRFRSCADNHDSLRNSIEPRRGSVTGQQNGLPSSTPLYDREDRFPVVVSDEVEPGDPVKRAKLKRQKQRYDNDAPFSNPGPKDAEIAFRPEWQFDFPALPAAESDAVVIGEVLSAEAHRSENKLNVFSNFGVRVNEVLKGNNLVVGSVINVQRIGGFVSYPNGRKVLFRLVGNGMPAVGSRYTFFLKALDDDFRILTGYELGPAGVMPLDNSRQFETYRRTTETTFFPRSVTPYLRLLLSRGNHASQPS